MTGQAFEKNPLNLRNEKNAGLIFSIVYIFSLDCPVQIFKKIFLIQEIKKKAGLMKWVLFWRGKYIAWSYDYLKITP